MNKENNKTSSPFLNGIFLGTVLGGLAFFALGTKEGKKSRQKLIKKGKKLLGNLETILDQVEEKNQIGEKLETLKKKVLPDMPIKIIKAVKKKRFFKKSKPAK